MLARLVLIAALLASCDRESSHVQRIAGAACLADEMPVLRGAWKPRNDCKANRAVCRSDCSAGDPNACLGVALASQDYSKPEIEDPPEVPDYFRRACKLGSAMGCTNWGAAELFATHSKVPLGCLYRVFDRTCDAGDPFGCTMTARILVEWGRSPMDKWIGYNVLFNACASYKGPPCRFLALYLERGEFGASDRDRIDLLMARACEGHDTPACGSHAMVGETLLPPIKSEK